MAKGFTLSGAQMDNILTRANEAPVGTDYYVIVAQTSAGPLAAFAVENADGEIFARMSLTADECMTMANQLVAASARIMAQLEVDAQTAQKH